MGVGRPQKADPGSVYAFAHQFYWSFRRLWEGSVRRRLDQKKYKALTEGLDTAQLTDSDYRKRHEEIVDEEIRSGRLEGSQRESRIRQIEDSESSVWRDWYLRQAAMEAQKEIKLPGEPDVIKVLLDPNTTPEHIREVCKESTMPRKITIGSETRTVEVSAWPIPSGDPFPTYLAQYAEQYVDALSDPRFPRSDRPSSRLKQFWFLSRALAGALYGVSPRTSINLVGSMRPEEVFDQSRQGRSGRKKRKPKRITNRKL
jgi:hypothetical protein